MEQYEVPVQVGIATIVIQSCANNCSPSELKVDFTSTEEPVEIQCAFCGVNLYGETLNKALMMWNEFQIKVRKLK